MSFIPSPWQLLAHTLNTLWPIRAAGPAVMYADLLAQAEAEEEVWEAVPPPATLDDVVHRLDDIRNLLAHSSFVAADSADASPAGVDYSPDPPAGLPTSRLLYHAANVVYDPALITELRDRAAQFAAIED